MCEVHSISAPIRSSNIKYVGIHKKTFFGSCLECDPFIRSSYKTYTRHFQSCEVFLHLDGLNFMILVLLIIVNGYSILLWPVKNTNKNIWLSPLACIVFFFLILFSVITIKARVRPNLIKMVLSFLITDFCNQLRSRIVLCHASAVRRFIELKQFMLIIIQTLNTFQYDKRFLTI